MTHSHHFVGPPPPANLAEHFSRCTPAGNGFSRLWFPRKESCLLVGGTLWIVVNCPQRKAHHFNHFKCTAWGTECTRGVGHHQPPPVSRIFSSSQIEPPSPLSPRSPALPRPGSAHRRQRQEARRRGRLAASSIRYLNKLNVFIKNPSPKPRS